jgi:hypothetical protein
VIPFTKRDATVGAWVNPLVSRIKLLINLGFSKGLAPPLSLLKRGTLRTLPVPPLERGVRGERTLILRQQTGTKFGLKLTPMGFTRIGIGGQPPRLGIAPTSAEKTS